MNLQADVFSRTERTANATECESNLFEWQTKTGCNLFLVFMQPLCGDEHLDACAATVRQGERCFKAQKSLVLHADFVDTFDDDLTLKILVASDDLLSANEIAIWVNRWSFWKNCQIRINKWLQYFVFDFYCC